ncbi:unnamed protein product [Blepharisma stoltei]|uniref:V-type proton ATPase subunit S1/VOA1 transmembrane domain-containing protein n=1 Tax=Blepharisma stoltei TaxID=1481888 RepID=A0AAU9JF88_9CILI|nr:unnamed protein product [Blepharisma stoltei]
MKELIISGFLLGVSRAATTDTENIPINPAALSGILIVLMLLVFLYVGLNALGSIEGPTTYSNVPLIVGKEK